MQKMTIDERLAKYTDRSSGCWVWLGAIDRTGYGRMRRGDRTPPAHRVSYEHFRGPIPAGLDLDHLCRNRSCVNPDHLEAVTRSENIRRGINHVADQARRQHCPKGHPLIGANLRSGPNRQCRACSNAQALQRRKAKRDLARRLIEMETSK